jgi:hypothetical protein
MSCYVHFVICKTSPWLLKLPRALIIPSLSITGAALPYLEAVESLDALWLWTGVCMYGHGLLVKEESFDADFAQVGPCITWV